MHNSTQVGQRYRWYRLLLAILLGGLVGIGALAVRYQQELGAIGQIQREAANMAIAQLDDQLAHAERISQNGLGWRDENCEFINPQLSSMAIHLETIRAVLWVKNGLITCSNLLHQPRKSLYSVYPELHAAKRTLVLRPAQLFNRGTPVLLLWLPTAQEPDSGIVHIFNIATLSSFILAPHTPYVEAMALNVAGHTLHFQERRILPYPALLGTAPQLELHSTAYPFSISLFAPSPRTLALQRLPQHVPLVLLLFLLVTGLVYLASANRMRLTYPLTQAMQRRELQLYCQPIIRTQSGDCEGVEILLRWYHPRHGWTSPEVFIPLAEQNGLIIPLTRYLLTMLAAQRHLFPADANFYLSINVAPEHVAQGLLVQDIQQLWLSVKPQQRLMVELTERTHLAGQDYAQRARLRELGIWLALDDFGTGQGSLSYLQDLQPDILKLDRTFCATIGSDAINATVLDSLIDLAHQLHLHLVAEGVENEQQADYLRDKGVYALQGFLFARPMPLSEFPRWLAQRGACQPVAGRSGPCQA
ncbi:c-di-GMP phosphodiesterase [Edwardsiella hoshinae]|uniref:cyclic-guanylate-specific phosphodiesterase n=1 Tax=Edwardsiella hoshinae TaxID=93378 RepID=A0A376DGU3_9GAMM|nr:cyclic diguanylate phosphodiesterase [Edwardsiella hoshinae]AOV97122.1 c-di-GMP phosphodiesterase [Edwardsiella hoshinae]QPR27036.1 EAL domain-containing protein [Edwardsiella hoshinae]STC88689.1 phage resistance protein [Edwardsiella hoshinae]